MSIPTTETKPDGLHRAPSKQSRQVRQALASAGPSQVKDFIHDLIRRNKLRGGFFLQLLFSLVLLSIGLIADLPLLVLVAAVLAPVLNPMIGVVISAIKPSASHLGESVLFLLITIIGFFGMGWLINLIAPIAITSDISSFFGLNNGWLEWTVLAIAAMVSAYLFLYHGGGPSVVTSTVFVYLIFIPLALAGLLISQGQMTERIDLLVIITARLFISILLMMITVWALGFSPKGSLGWILLTFVLIISALAIVEMRSEQFGFAFEDIEPLQAVAASSTVEQTALVQATTSPMSKLDQLPTPTEKPLPTQVAAEVLTEVTTQRFARVISESGVVVRESASTQAAIVTYISNGLQVTLVGEEANVDNMDWERVIAPDGKEGWVAARFLSEVNP